MPARINYMKKASKTSRTTQGFSLAEVLATLVIGAMILVTVLGIYTRTERSAAAIKRKMDSCRLPREILQRIAEDLDKIITAQSDTKITIDNKFEKGYPTARMIIQKRIYDKDNKKQTFEEIIWQTSYDFDTNSLTLYRSHNGIASEDKLLDEKRANWEKQYPFVPICTGVTFFQILVPKGENFQNKWTSNSLPAGITVTISFAQPYRTVAGTLQVPDSEKFTRTIAIDRARKLRFTLPKMKEQIK